MSMDGTELDGWNRDGWNRDGWNRDGWMLMDRRRMDGHLWMDVCGQKFVDKSPWTDGSR